MAETAAVAAATVERAVRATWVVAAVQVVAIEAATEAVCALAAEAPVAVTDPATADPVVGVAVTEAVEMTQTTSRSVKARSMAEAVEGAECRQETSRALLRRR